MYYMNKILDVMNAPKYKGYTVDQFKEYFNVKTSKEFTELMKSLNALEDEYEIMQDKKHCYFTLAQMECFRGKLRVNPKGFGFVENDDISVYANNGEIKKAMDQDEVLARLIHNKDGSSECEILKVIAHSKRTIVGVIKKKGKRTWFLPDTIMPDKRFKILNTNDFKLVNDTKVQVYIERYGEVMDCSIVKILGHKYDPGVDILSILMDYDIEPQFPVAVTKEVNRIDENITCKDKVGRTDYTNLTVFTIDGDDSKDLDDAISIEKIDVGYRLGVHIADVSNYVKAGSAIDKEAYKRGTSVYVVDRVVPMLPQVLSNGICSLNPKVERLTISCVMDFDLKGEIVAYQIVPSVIRSCERMTYRNVNKLLEHDIKLCKRYEHILYDIEMMHELSLILRKKRNEAGHIDFETRESKIIVDAKGRVKDIKLRERGESERMIEDFMISANECVATHVKFMDLPSIYRVHETPEAKKMREFAGIAASMGYKLKGDINKIYPRQLQALLDEAKNDDSFPVLSAYMLRSMRKARYDVSCLGHFGLALNEYTHFTSPIRRYPDLIVHRMLRKYLFSCVEDVTVIQKDIEWIEEAAIHSSSRERNAVNAEREVDDMKKCEYMERYIGAKFDGVISSVTKFGVFVELENTVEGLVHITNMRDDYYHYDEVAKVLVGERSANVYKMGQRVRVKVLDASRFRKQIDFEIVRRSR